MNPFFCLIFLTPREPRHFRGKSAKLIINCQELLFENVNLGSLSKFRDGEAKKL